MTRKASDVNRGSVQHDSRVDMWPGIFRGFDANCDGCTWATKDGTYQIKLRSQFCPNHGGALESALARARRSRSITPAQVSGDGGRWDA